MSTQQEAKKPGMFTRMSRYFKDLRGELKKVVWPTRRQLANNSLIVIVMVLFIGALIYGIDQVMNRLVSWLIEGFQ